MSGYNWSSNVTPRSESNNSYSSGSHSIPREQVYNFKNTNYMSGGADAIAKEPASQDLTSLFEIFENDVKDTLGVKYTQISSAIPYIFNIVGDLIVNPSTVSPSTFKKMVESDAIIYSCLLNHVEGILNTLGPYINKNKDIEKHARVAMQANKRGFKTLCRDILTAIYAGFSRQEMVWGYNERLRADIVIKTSPIPQNAALFRVDIYGDLHEWGVGVYVFNSFYPGFSSLFSYGMGNVFQPLANTLSTNSVSNYYPSAVNGGVDPYSNRGDMDTPYRTYTISPIGLRFLPTDKTIGFENYGLTNNQNPYGKSILRSCYNLYVFKYGVMQFLGMALDKKSAPLLVGYAKPDVPSGDFNPDNPQTNRITDSVRALSGALRQAKGSSAIVLGGMKGEVFDLEAIDVEGNIDIFIDTLRWIDEGIMQNLMTPKTTFGGEGSHSLGYSQRDIQGTYITSRRDDLQDVLINQYIKPMIEEAFTPDEHDDDFGCFEMLRTSIDDQVKLSQIYKTAYETGVFDLTNISDYNTTREALGAQRVEVLPGYLKKMQDALISSGVDTQPQMREKMDSVKKPYAHTEN